MTEEIYEAHEEKSFQEEIENILGIQNSETELKSKPSHQSFETPSNPQLSSQTNYNIINPNDQNSDKYNDQDNSWHKTIDNKILQQEKRSSSPVNINKGILGLDDLIQQLNHLIMKGEEIEEDASTSSTESDSTDQCYVDWSYLPGEVMKNIMSRFSSYHVKNARLVCQAWKEIISKNFSSLSYLAPYIEDLSYLAAKYPCLQKLILSSKSDSYFLQIQMPFSFVKLSSLTALELDGCLGFNNGYFPPTWKTIPDKIKYLSIKDCDIDCHYARSISRLDYLEVLKLQNLYILGKEGLLSILKNNTNLKELTLTSLECLHEDHCDFIFKNMMKLQILDLSQNEHLNFHDVKFGHSITHLDVTGCPNLTTKALTTIAKIPNLQHLGLSYYPHIETGFREFCESKGRKGFYSLHLECQCPQYPVENLVFMISDLERLEVLSLTMHSHTRAFLDNFKLCAVRLTLKKITIKPLIDLSKGYPLKAFYDMTDLTYLSLENMSGLHSEFAEDYLIKLTYLKTLYINSALITDGSLRAFSEHLKYLEDLSIDNCKRFGSKGMKSLGMCKRLTRLSIRNTNVTDTSLFFLSYCPMSHLYISGCFGITMLGLELVVVSKTLEYIEAYGCPSLTSSIFRSNDEREVPVDVRREVLSVSNNPRLHIDMD